jgi:predicted  nucleic acid-binding Zn-ribbon protein
MKTPSVPMSWGELIDKITILEIKSERLTSAEALSNVRHELALLAATAIAVDDRIAALKAQLRAINETLWKIEDDIRGKEARQEFDAGFIELARNVYKTNDERGRIKREINTALASELVEEKSYFRF